MGHWPTVLTIWLPPPRKLRTIVFYTIIIIVANTFMKEIHESMPFILERQSYDKWVKASPAEAAELMRPAPPDIVQKRIVNAWGASSECVRGRSGADTLARGGPLPGLKLGKSDRLHILLLG